MAGPLSDLRVLDLSRVLAGPWCTQILGDMGADVIKVERPGSGDEARGFGPPWMPGARTEQESPYFICANRGKRSITVDLGTPEGQTIVSRLAAVSDVLVENFKTGDLARKRLGYEDLRAVNPRLIYCSITGFGWFGPQAKEPGYDYLIQAQGGLMSLTGLPDGVPGGGPTRVGVAVSDLTTGMNAAIAILAALHSRVASGRGQVIDMAMLDVQVSWLANQAQAYFATRQAPPRTGDQHASIVPYQPFKTLDGLLVIAVGNDEQFRRLSSVLQMPNLAKDQRFVNNAARVANRCELCVSLERAIASWRTADLRKRLNDEGVPCGPINQLDQVFSDPQVLARNMIVELEHASLGPVRTVANPAKFSETPLEYDRAPPVLGQHTREVLREVLEFSDDAIDEFAASGAI